MYPNHGRLYKFEKITIILHFYSNVETDLEVVMKTTTGGLCKLGYKNTPALTNMSKKYELLLTRHRKPFEVHKI